MDFTGRSIREWPKDFAFDSTTDSSHFKWDCIECVSPIF